MEQVKTRYRYYNTLRDRDEPENNEQLFELPIRVYLWYRDNVKHINENITYDLAKKKLSRNVYLAKQTTFHKDGDDRLYFHYGNLLIVLDSDYKGDYEIVYLSNTSENTKRFYVDFTYRNHLNLKFGIEENKYINNTYKDVEEITG